MLVGLECRLVHGDVTGDMGNLPRIYYVGKK